MRVIQGALLSFLLTVGFAAQTTAAGPEDDFKTAYATAEAANKQAGALRNQWTVTASALAGAKKAAAESDFDKAIALSKEAEALAKASIVQATHEKEVWKDAEIR